MKPRNTPELPKIYQLKITLRYSKPSIWRRILVPGGTTLDELERIIKIAMGWAGGHMHDFCLNGVYYGSADNMDELGFADETKYTLQELITEPKSTFSYTYDFGDDWRHNIVVEKIMDTDPELTYPLCLKGAGACPPDDCGGIPGYYQMLEALGNPKHPEHRSLRNWVGYEFDPTEFSVLWVNKQFAALSEKPAAGKGVKRSRKRPTKGL
ncbi:MAG: plasmid pRiA4b ORF-3 family protein [Verrucomicrobiales bacterium]